MASFPEARGAAVSNPCVRLAFYLFPIIPASSSLAAPAVSSAEVTAALTATRVKPAANTSARFSRADAADGEGREPDLRRHRPQQLDAGELPELLGGRGIRRPDADVVGPVEHGLPGLLDAVRRYAHQRLRPDNPPGVLHRDVFLADVNAVGRAQGRQIRPVVDDAQRTRGASRGPQQPGTGEQLTVAEPLVAELDHVYAGLDEPPYKPLELLGRLPAVHRT